MRAWLSVVRPMSSLLTILLVSLLQCVKVDILGTPCEADLNWAPNHSIYFYITDKLHFFFLISFWYPHFLLLSTNPLACNWELSPPLSTCLLQLNSLFPLSSVFEFKKELYKLGRNWTSTMLLTTIYILHLVLYLLPLSSSHVLFFILCHHLMSSSLYYVTSLS